MNRQAVSLAAIPLGFRRLGEAGRYDNVARVQVQAKVSQHQAGFGDCAQRICLWSVRSASWSWEELSMKTLIIALLLLANASGAHASTLTLTPVVEGFIRDIPKDGIGDFSTVAWLRHGNFTGYWAEDRGIVEFDLRGLGLVRRAHLVARENFNSIREPVALSLHAYRGDGILSLTDFAEGTPLGETVHELGGRLELDATDFVNEAISLRYDFIGFNLRQDSVTMAGVVEYEPSYLEIIPGSSAVPEPGSIWLMGAAVVGLYRLRKRSPALC